MPKPEVTIRPTLPADTETLITNLRDADFAECLAYGHPSVGDDIRRSVARSMFCWSGFIGGELAAILGVTPLDTLGGVGSPWMLGTPVLDKHSRILVQATPDYIARMLKAFPHLVNFVHAENKTSVRWLRRLGFTLHDAVPYGKLGAPFHPFEMRA